MSTTGISEKADRMLGLELLHAVTGSELEQARVLCRTIGSAAVGGTGGDANGFIDGYVFLARHAGRPVACIRYAPRAQTVWYWPRPGASEPVPTRGAADVGWFASRSTAVESAAKSLHAWSAEWMLPNTASTHWMAWSFGDNLPTHFRVGAHLVDAGGHRAPARGGVLVCGPLADLAARVPSLLAAAVPVRDSAA